MEQVYHNEKYSGLRLLKSSPYKAGMTIKFEQYTNEIISKIFVKEIKSIDKAIKNQSSITNTVIPLQDQ